MLSESQVAAIRTAAIGNGPKLLDECYRMTGLDPVNDEHWSEAEAAQVVMTLVAALALTVVGTAKTYNRTPREVATGLLQPLIADAEEFSQWCEEDDDE